MAIERGKSAKKQNHTQQLSGTSGSEKLIEPDFGTPTNARRSSVKQTRHAKPWTYSRRGYALAQGFRQLRARKLSSLTTLLVFGVTLALPALILFTASSLAELGNKSVGEESLTAYLSLQTSDLDGAALAQQLQALAEVKTTRYISRDEALAIFYEQADVSGAVDVLGENPLPGAIILYPEKSALNETTMTQLANRVQVMANVDIVQFDLRWVFWLLVTRSDLSYCADRTNLMYPDYSARVDHSCTAPCYTPARSTASWVD